MLKTTLISQLKPEFSFAGFQFPKYVWTLPAGNFAKRIDRHKTVVCGEYYHAPRPVNGSHPGIGFYLDSDGMPKLRWTYCDEVDGTSIRHTGWFTDDSCSQTIRGIVMRLPHGRGFLAGWTMGEGMASEVDGYIYSDEFDAAYAADSMAERAAENQREYEESQEDEEE